MNGPRKFPRVPIMAGLAIGVIGALLIIPGTRWIVRSDIGLAIPVGDSRASLAYLGVRDSFGQPDLNRAAELVERYARERPTDYQAQLGAALTFLRPLPKGGRLDYAEAVRPLMARFPENPSPYANYLRLMCMGRLRVNRDESDNFDSHLKPSDPKPVRKQVDPVDMEQFKEAAETGERLDPENAYFPMMSAMGHFAAKEDAQAYDALERSAKCSTWKEYYDDQVYAQWRLADEALGDPSSITRTSITAAVLFPHLAQMRAVARIVTYQAINLEKEGKYEEALSMRHNLMRASSIMRANGQTLICTLVAKAMEAITASRPAGAPIVKTDSRLPEVTRTELMLQPYLAHLHKIGHDDEAAWVKAEFALSLKAREITQGGLKTWDPVRELIGVMLWRMSGLLLLSSALVMLLVGGAAALLGRTAWFKSGKPVPPGVMLGTFLAICLVVFGTGVAVGPSSAATWPLVLTGLVGTLLSFAFCKRKIARAAAISFLVTEMCLGMAALAATWEIGGIVGLYKVSIGLVSTGEGNTSGFPYGMVLAAVTFGGILAVPVVTVIGLAIFSKVCRVPISIGVVRGTRGLALPIASLMLITYGAVTVGTARKDARLSYSNERWVQHEGKWYAELAGKEWPGLSW